MAVKHSIGRNAHKITLFKFIAFVLVSNKFVSGKINGPCSTDAAFTWNGDGKLYLFKDDRYMSWDDGAVSSIKDWKLPANIDAALTLTTRKDINYIFKGCSVWTIYQSAKTMTLGPFHLSQVFRGIPCDLDAATMINGKIYFFKGRRCWVWDDKLAMALEGGLEMWKEVKGRIDSAFNWDGKTYLLQGKSYWRYDGERNKTSLGETMIGWPRLVNGPLLPYCACDCTNCCHSNWDFHTIEYNKKATKYKPLHPETIDEHMVDNRNTTIAPTVGFLVTKNVTESELFLNSKSETMEIGRKFNCPIPLMNEGRIISSNSAPIEHKWAQTSVDSRVHSVKYVSPTVPGKKVRFTSTLHRVHVTVPFTMTMKYRYRQCTCKIDGNLRMEKMSQIKMKVTQDD